MNIVVLDGYTLNPGDLSWDGLKSLGSVTLHERTPADQIIPRLAGAEIAITNKVPFNKETLAALPKLRYVGVTATGYNIIDTTAAKERKIIVTNVPTYGTRSVAQHTFALLLELTQHAGHHAQTVRDGRWAKSIDWCYNDYPLIELDGLVLGIVGFGRIGRAVAELAQAFGMKVQTTASSHHKERPSSVSTVQLDDLFATSDVVSLHCPLTDETRQLVNAARLARMKPTAFLINTSRGPLIDESALAEALNSSRIAGAALDVLSLEPPKADNPLLPAKNCVITPHNAWATRAARSRLMEIAVANVKAFVDGQPQNVVH